MELDHIDNIKIVPGVSTITNFHSIPQLLEGIFMTYNHINTLQENYWDLRYPDASEMNIDIFKKSCFSMSGELNQVDAQAVNLFHWYSINLINYARCCGLVKFINKKGILPDYLAGDKELIAELKVEQKSYLDSIPELISVRHFRNKASAHLAYTDPKRDDNPATLIESMSIIPTFVQGEFRIGIMTRGRGDHKSSFSDHPWSLTENFKSLIPRYFKNYFG